MPVDPITTVAVPHTGAEPLEDLEPYTTPYEVTPKPKKPKFPHPILDEDGKLSAAGAATSLKYARAQDLPSFPSVGLKLASAGAAASLADRDKHSVDLWKQGDIPAAHKAAMLAKDYEMDPLWQPELSAAGSKAALLAAKEGGNVDVWRPSSTDAGSSAAGQAMKNSKPPGAITERDVTADGHRKALMAATGAMKSNRQRADSAPIRQDNSAWALNAARGSQRERQAKAGPFTSGDPGFDAARIEKMAQTTMSREMYTSHPPVGIEVEEKNHEAQLKASAVAMARQMYAIQQKHIDEAKGGARPNGRQATHKVRGRKLSESSEEEPVPVNQYGGLEEAARKLAQERLAKLYDKDEAYRKYYGQPTPARSSLSTRLRRKASSDAGLEDGDEEQARKVRSQMSIFQNKLAEVDSKKRQSDREALLQTAQRNVQARMSAMDEKVFQETGKSSPHQRELWEKAAREKAQADSDVRMEHHGMVHIGGGKYLDQAEVDAIARKRLQPTFDDINEKAEKQRAHDEEVRLEQERQRKETEAEKARWAEVKERVRKTKEEEKRAEQARKSGEQARRAEEKRHLKEEDERKKSQAKIAKEEKRRSKEIKAPGPSDLVEEVPVAKETVVEPVETAPTVTALRETTHLPTSDLATAHHLATFPQPAAALEEDTQPVVITDVDPAKIMEDAERAPIVSTTVEEGVTPSTSTPAGKTAEREPLPSFTKASVLHKDEAKSESKVKSWLKSRFRSSSKTPKDSPTADGKKPGAGEKSPGFVGGAALTGASVAGSTSEPPEATRDDSMREVAMVGRTSTQETEDMYDAPEPKFIGPQPAAAGKAVNRSPSISSLSSEEKEVPEAPRGRRGFKERPISKVDTNASANDDEFEEAKDRFEEEKLTPPPKLTGGLASSNSPSRERSKFTEAL